MYLSKNARRKNDKSVALAYLFYNWDVLRCAICPVLYKKRDITPKIPERFNHRLNKKITYTSTSNTNKPKGENWMNYFTSTQGIFNRLASFLIFPATCPIPIAQ